MLTVFGNRHQLFSNTITPIRSITISTFGSTFAASSISDFMLAAGQLCWSLRLYQRPQCHSIRLRQAVSSAITGQYVIRTPPHSAVPKSLHMAWIGFILPILCLFNSEWQSVSKVLESGFLMQATVVIQESRRLEQ